MHYVAEALVDETRAEMAYFWQPPTADFEYTRPVARRGTLWGDLVVADVKLLWALRRQVCVCVGVCVGVWAGGGWVGGWLGGW